MSWKSAQPLDTWKPESKEVKSFLREIYKRFAVAGGFTWNPPNVPAASTVDTTLTTANGPELAGLRPGMVVILTPPSSIDAGLVAWAWCPADDQLTIRLANVTAGAVNPAQDAWSFLGVV